MLGLAASSQAGAIRAQAAPRGCCRPRVCVLASARQGSSGGPTDAAAAAPSALPLAEGLSRRSLLGAAAAASGALLLPAAPAGAVQGSIAGRIPGLTGPNAEGYYTYKRPEGKSGGHGVGWTELPRYSFEVPPGWEEVPVSIADLGGTEIDLRFGSPQTDEGQLQVVVAPVLRFRDVGTNADVRIDFLGPPKQLIEGFAPELYGKPITEDDVLDTRVVQNGGIPYYLWELKPHNLVVATAVGSRVFILAVSANSRQWRKAQGKLRHIQESFRVPVA